MASRKPRKDELALRVMELSRELSTAGIVFHQAIAQHLGLNITDHKCLDLIARHENVVPGDLAEWTGLTTGAVTAIIDRLESAGFVTRGPHPDDGRKVVIVPAQERLKDVCQLFEPMAKRMLELLMSYDRDQLETLVTYTLAAKEVMRSATEKVGKPQR